MAHHVVAGVVLRVGVIAVCNSMVSGAPVVSAPLAGGPGTICGMSVRDAAWCRAHRSPPLKVVLKSSRRKAIPAGNAVDEMPICCPCDSPQMTSLKL